MPSIPGTRPIIDAVNKADRKTDRQLQVQHSFPRALAAQAVVCTSLSGARAAGRSGLGPDAKQEHGCVLQGGAEVLTAAEGLHTPAHASKSSLH